MDKLYVKELNIVDEKLAKLSSFKELTLFFLKYSFQPTKILGALILILIIFFGAIAEVPYYFAFGGTINFSLFLISAMIYGSIFYTFRKSTIFENIRKTNLSKKEIYLSIFVSMFLFTGLMYLFLIALFSLSIFVNSPLLINDWFFASTGNGEGGLFLNELNIQLLFWWYFAFILLNFALFYFFQNIANTKKTFFLFIFLYLILLVIYGNTLNPPEVRMNYDALFIEHSALKATLNTEYGLSDSEIRAILDHFHIQGSLEVRINLKTKFQNEHYISMIFSVIIPHSWINTFCAAIWKGTALKSKTISFIIPSSFSYFQEPVQTINYNISYQNDFLKNAPIWKIKGQIWWALSMYIWILYFGILYFIGNLFSRVKKT